MQGDAEQQRPPPLAMVMVVTVVMSMVMGVIVEMLTAQFFQTEGHGLDQCVKAQAHESHGPEPVPMDVAMLHAFAEVFQTNLNEETGDDPLTGIPIHQESFGQEVQETQPEGERAPECEQQGHVLLEPVTKPFASQTAGQGYKYEGDGCDHVVAK